jgi:hypothetical protein
MNNFLLINQLKSIVDNHKMCAINQLETIKLFQIEKQDDINSFKQGEN